TSNLSANRASKVGVYSTFAHAINYADNFLFFAIIRAVIYFTISYLIPQERIHHETMFACCLGDSHPRIHPSRRPKQISKTLSSRREDFHRADEGESSSVYCGGDREKETACRRRNGKEKCGIHPSRVLYKRRRQVESDSLRRHGQEPRERPTA